MAVDAKEIKLLSASELAGLIRNKDLSANEIVDITYNNIEAIDPKIESFNSLTKDLAYSIAKDVDKKVKNKEILPPLAGVPIAIKDNICIKDNLTTCSSSILKNFKPPYTATAVNNVIDNLLIPVGKTNLDEFAMGSSTENSAFKTTRNPWDLNRVPGGSSGGSAASVGSLQTSLALGSDTGGSVRLPASFCGVLGLKPTYGLVSRFGLIAYASSLDQIGPFARTVEDLTLLFQAIAGYDKKDSTSINMKIPDYLKILKSGIEGFKIGVISELMGDKIDTEVRHSCSNAIKILENNGAKIDYVSMPHNKYAIATYYIIATAEASANLARYDGVKYGHRSSNPRDIIDMYVNTREEGFGQEVKRRIMLGTYVLSSGYYDAYYKKAQQVRSLIKEDFDKVFSKYDLLVCPVSPTTAFEIGSRVDDPLSMYLSDIATVTVNLAGIPGLSIPCGLDKNNMPIGLQLIGPVLSESKIFQAAYQIEQNINFSENYNKFVTNL